MASLSIAACLLAGLSSAHAQQPIAATYTRHQLIAMARQMVAQPNQSGNATDARERRLDSATMLAVRTTSGRAELHSGSADEYFVLAGQAELITGGVIVHPQGSGEVRGESIAGGEHRILQQGSVAYIPPHTPHQVVVRGGAPFIYIIVKLAVK